MELLILVVVLVIAAVVFLLAFSSAKVGARDQRRVIDVTQIQKALTVYFQENGYYPYSTGDHPPSGITAYLDTWPTAPAADGRCSASQNTYLYTQRNQGDDYSLTFCFGRRTAGLSAGPHTLNSQGLQ